MKTLTILFITFFSIINVFGQKLELKKASPFTAVKWENEEPIVKFNEEWYQFEKLDHLSKKELLDFCKKEYGKKWQKRFSEDLVEVLKGLNFIPNKQVNLELSESGITKPYVGVFTFENRQRCLLYNETENESKPVKKILQKISKEQALSDLKQFQEVLDTKSSYAQISPYNYVSAIEELAVSISKKESEISINELTNEISKIMSEIGDRHSSIKNESFDRKSHKSYNLKLPFGITILDEKVIAVKQKSNDYAYYSKKFPFVKSINDIHIETLIDKYNYRDKKAPIASQLNRGADAIQNYGALLFKNNIECPEKIEVVFTNGEDDKKETFELTENKKGYTSSLSVENFNSIMQVNRGGELNNLSKVLNSDIGYIKIPMMFHYDKVDGLKQFFENSFQEFSNTKALIIDIRNNPGGRREILQTFADYIVQPQQSPWVANVAYLRSDQVISTDESSMSSRYLYNYNSEKLSDSDKIVIDAFNKTFKTEKVFDNLKFSSPFYMVLRAGKTSYTKPVYILVNERSFSAATVFTTAFKGLPNVKIVGVTTDGSSGNSKIMHLKYSTIRVKVSTMLSFQRNGKTLDGNGTEPDIYIPIDSTQIFTGKDTQLKKLIDIINE